MRPRPPDVLAELSRDDDRIREQEIASSGGDDRQIDWADIPLTNGWTGDGQFEPRYSRVYLRGTITPGTTLHAGDLALHTTLLAGVGPGATTLTVADTTDWPTTGTVLVNDVGNVFTYTALSGGVLTGTYVGASFGIGTDAWGGDARPPRDRYFQILTDTRALAIAHVDPKGRLWMPSLDAFVLDSGRYVT